MRKLEPKGVLRALTPVPAPVLGVDIGSSSVKIVELSSGPAGVTVRASGRRDLRPGPGADGREAPADPAAALKALLREGRFSARVGGAALPGGAGILKTLKPGARADDARANSPFAADETALDAAVRDGGSVVLLARTSVVERWASVLARAGVAAEALTVDAVALEGLAPAGAPVALVNAGAAVTCIAVMDAGGTRTARTVNVAGDAFTRAIEQELGVSAREAEECKIEYGLLGRDEGAAPPEAAAAAGPEAARIYRETSARVYKALKPGVRDLCAELKRTLEADRARRAPEAPAPIRVVLAGGTAALKGLREALEAEVGLPVETFSAAGEGGADLAVAYGLALAAASRARRPAPNLAPAPARRAAAVRRVLPGPHVFAAAVMLVALVWMALSFAAPFVDRRLVAGESSAAAGKRRPKLKKKPAAWKAPPARGKGAPPAKRASPYAFLRGLKASGALGAGRDAIVMLSGRRGAYTARGGRLFDQDEKVVEGVRAEVRDGRLTLDAPGERVSVPLPK